MHQTKEIRSLAFSRFGRCPAPFLSAPFRPRTYGNLLYLLLAFPLGVRTFVFSQRRPDRGSA